MDELLLQMDHSVYRKTNFLEKVLRMESEKQSHYNVMTREDYSKLVLEVEEAASSKKKTAIQYRRLKRFQVIEVGGAKKLATKSSPIKYFATVDEIFDIIEAAHLSVGHGGRDRLKQEASREYANITIEMINIFLSSCDVCQLKKSKKVFTPILPSQLNSRGQFDLIDMRSRPDDDFKFIMVYQDHQTEFVVLRPLQDKSAKEIAVQLTDIFLLFGAPCILHSFIEQKFVSHVLSEMSTLWPELKLVYGKIQRSVSAKEDIQTMLETWMKDNSSKWSEGLRLIQFMKNRTLHAGIKMSPYKAMFGIEPRVGISSFLPLDVLENIQTEEDLDNLVTRMRQNDGASEEADDSITYRNDAHENTSKRVKISDMHLDPLMFVEISQLPI